MATKTYDLSTSTKWANLSDGDHTVQIIAKADGYRASEASSAVTFEIIAIPDRHQLE